MIRLPGVALACVLALTACTSPAPAPSPSSTTAAPSTAPAGPRYKYQPSTVNLCDKTDLGPIAALNLTVKSKNNAAPQAGPGEACLIEATTPSGKMASLRAEAVVLTSVDQAKLLYKAQHDTTRMNPDAAISGLGDEAEGFTLESSPGFPYAEYRVHARRDNLVIEIWLAVGGDNMVPKATLKVMAQAVAAATLSTVDGAWRNA